MKGGANLKKLLQLFLISTLSITLFVSCKNSNTEKVTENTISTISEIVDINDIATENNNSNYPIVVYQSDNSILEIEAKPEKVMVLSHVILEILDTLEINVAAAGSLSSNPHLLEKFINVIDVGISTNPDMETVASVDPDIIIAGSLFSNLKERFDEQNYQSWFLNNQSYSDTINIIESFGKVFDKEEQAYKIINSFENQKNTILNDINGKVEDKKIMVIFGSGDNLSFGTSDSFVGSVVKLLGSQNVTDGLNLGIATAGYVPFTYEVVLEIDPDIIFRISHGDLEDTKAMFDEVFDNNPAFRELTAYKNDNVHDLDYDLFFSNPGIKTIEAMEIIADLISE